MLRNTCHGPRTSIPQRVGCLPLHTDRVQQDIRPTDSPAPSAQKSGNTTKGAEEPRVEHTHTYMHIYTHVQCLRALVISAHMWSLFTPPLYLSLAKVLVLRFCPAADCILSAEAV